MPTTKIKAILQTMETKTPAQQSAARRLTSRAAEIDREDEERRIRRTCTPTDQALLKRIVDAGGTDAWLAKKILQKGEAITESDRRFIETKK